MQGRQERGIGLGAIGGVAQHRWLGMDGSWMDHGWIMDGWTGRVRSMVDEDVEVGVEGGVKTINQRS
ncbi:hypothetical protein K504DRAFT_462197 [Pleomassaria siparia CBS 279.74]|uniref:Uncharacterized protein n=1 Tax=Pleomassaria siparia CBS 279.74 TaxID=1314801 RepID=A0A6G1KMS1_9PLEO|nr:hypothetical protein K504DRAFT_462197 [Pleomassaria siparia CBS 279.74]